MTQAEDDERPVRSKWPRRILAILLLGPALLVVAALAGRWSLAAAGREFDATATETVAAWTTRHPLRVGDARARELLELGSRMASPRKGDPPPQARIDGLLATRDALGRAHDATPLPRSPELRAWMDARQGELNRVITLLTEGAPPRWQIRSGDHVAKARLIRPFAWIRQTLLARALDDAARGLPERAERDLAAVSALLESWSELPEPAGRADGDLLAAIRVVRPADADAWIARLDALHVRKDLHDMIVWRAASLRARVAASSPDDWSVDPAQRPFLPIPRAFAAARDIRTLGVLDARLATIPSCADPLVLAPLLIDERSDRRSSPNRSSGVNRGLLLRLRAAEVDLALTRRVLELCRDLSSPPRDACAAGWLTETRDGSGAVTVAWNGVLPPGVEPEGQAFPQPFTVRPAPALPQP